MGTGVLASIGYPTAGKHGFCTLTNELPPVADKMTSCHGRPGLVGAISQDIRTVLVFELLGGPQPVANLACTCRDLLQQLRDPRTGRLRVSTASLSASASALMALAQRLSLDQLRSLRLDIFKESGNLPERLVNQLLSSLGDALTAAKQVRPLPLEDLSVRLASFSDNVQPLRPSSSARAALLRGLASLRLRRFELSFFPLKRKEIEQEVSLETSKNQGPTFLSVLSSLESLQELVLTHNGMYGEVALQLVEAVRHLPYLQTLDVSRNRIAYQEFNQMASILGGDVTLTGLDSQTYLV